MNGERSDIHEAGRVGHTEQDTVMNDSPLKTAAADFLDAHARVDQDRMTSLLAADARFHTMKSAGAWVGMPDVITGATTISGMLATRHGANGGPAIWQAGKTSWEHHFFVEEGDHVVIFTTRRSVTVDGKDYENPYVCIFRFNADKITDLWEVLDSAYAQSVVTKPENTTSAWRGE